MNRERIGLILSTVGMSLIISCIAYPFGQMAAEMFKTLIVLGNAFIFLGIYFRPIKKKTK